MKRYEYLGGGQVMGTSTHEVVEMMRSTSHTPTDSIQEYMEQTARRCRLQRGAAIRTDTVDHFIADLVSAEFLIPVS